MTSPATYVVTAFLGWLSYRWYLFRVNLRKVDNIPTVGYDSFFGAYLTSWRYFVSSPTLLAEGYKKYPGAAFKIANFESSTGWSIYVSGLALGDDIRKAGDAYLSSSEPTRDVLKTDYVFGPGNFPQPARHHTLAISRGMTRGVGDLIPSIQDEIAHSFGEYIPLTKDWTSRTIFSTALSIVTRLTNRVFVGLPLARDPEYCSIVQNYPVRLMMSVYAVTLAPTFLRPFVAYLTSGVPATEKRITEILGPMVKERVRKHQEIGVNWPGKSNDLVSWLLENAPEEACTEKDLISRVIVTNFASNHSTTMTLSDVLLRLAAHREYIEPLRAEIEEVIENQGMSKESIAKLYKLDSFLRETGRVDGVHNATASRKVLQDFTFSNGLTIPKDFTVALVSRAVHTDPTVYENPEVFDPYRFLPDHPESATDDAEYGGNIKAQMVSLDNEYLFFGTGRHACPGRWFAVNEIKGVLVYVLLNYDMKLPNDETTPPPGRSFGVARVPDPAAKILFRKRQIGNTL